MRDVKERHPTRLALVNSVNPDRIQGQKTAAFEICDALGRAPDYHLLPVGNAGNITAYWMGYREYHEAGASIVAPHMMGFEAAGAAPIVHGHVVEGAAHHRHRDPHRQPGELGGRHRARATSRAARSRPCDDEDILAAYRLLARTEGVFAEPASAISAGRRAALGASGRLRPGDVLVLTLTGHGLKDPDTAIANSEPASSIPADLARLAAVLELELRVAVGDEESSSSWATGWPTSRSPSWAARRRSRRARTPHLDHMAARGILGLTRTPARRVAPRRRRRACLAVLGYDPVPLSGTARCGLEAAGLGVALARDDVAFRCDLVDAGRGRRRHRDHAPIRRRRRLSRTEGRGSSADLARDARRRRRRAASRASAIAICSSGAAARRDVRTMPPYDARR